MSVLILKSREGSRLSSSLFDEKRRPALLLNAVQAPSVICFSESKRIYMAIKHPREENFDYGPILP